jgi:hypothetical protein
MKCETCHDSDYVQAPPENAWKKYFARVGRPHQSVLIDCPKCKCECGEKLRTDEATPYCPCCDGNP